MGDGEVEGVVCCGWGWWGVRGGRVRRGGEGGSGAVVGPYVHSHFLCGRVRAVLYRYFGRIESMEVHA